jgi:predicted RNA-binding protein YlxR (DUF448 family)
MPERSCVVCRGKSDRFAGESEALIRFVTVVEASCRRVVCDLYGSKPGRGVYVHLAPRCLGERKAIRAVIAGFQRSARQSARQTARSAKPSSRSDAAAEAGRSIDVGAAEELGDLIEAELAVAVQQQVQADERSKSGSEIGSARRSARFEAVREVLNNLQKSRSKSLGKSSGKAPDDRQKGIQRVRL